MTVLEIPLVDEQVRALEKLTRTRNESVASLVQDAVDKLIRSASPAEWEERKRRALAAAGKFRSTTGDLSARHDEYFAEAADEKEGK